MLVRVVERVVHVDERPDVIGSGGRVGGFVAQLKPVRRLPGHAPLATRVPLIPATPRPSPVTAGPPVGAGGRHFYIARQTLGVTGSRFDAYLRQPARGRCLPIGV